MNVDTQIKLNELVADYDVWLNRDAEDGLEMEVSQENFRSLRLDVILPIMEEVAVALRNHGHMARVFGYETSVDAGGFAHGGEAMMIVRPKRRQPAVREDSDDFTASFAFQMPERKILAQVTGNGAERPGYARPYDLHPVEGVTRELIERELLEMVRYGLDCARLEDDARRPARAAAE